jgi:hypothetical protein
MPHHRLRSRTPVEFIDENGGGPGCGYGSGSKTRRRRLLGVPQKKS